MSGGHAISGELGLLSLFDLGQLLTLNRASGVLTIEQGGKKGHFYFHDGRIVNAIDPEWREGEQSAYTLFAWKTGRFEFRPDTTDPNGPIEVTSEALMLEAARRMDEKSAQSGGPPDAATEKLRERAGQLDELRQAFHAAVVDARSARGASPSDTLPQANATRPDDRTVFRPGHPVRMKLQGEWRESHDAAMSTTEYVDLSRRITTGPGVITSPGGRIIARLTGGRSWSVTRIVEHRGESLWLRPVDLAPAARERFHGRPEELALLDEMRDGLVLVGGANADAASQVIHALVAARGEFPEGIVIAADHSVYRHRPARAVICEVEPPALADALAATQPTWVALDTEGPYTPGAFARLGGVRVIVARASGANPEAWFARWLSGLTPSDANSCRAFVAGHSVVGVWSGAVADENEPIELRAWTLARADGGEARAA